MKKPIIVFLILFICQFRAVLSQMPEEISVQLLTIGPGTETYSHYGHSALRIIIPERGTDIVYNWGVFDFNTKNFAWKFAKGRLNYMLDTEQFKDFIEIYTYEKRWVESQKINLEPEEIGRLFGLINENMKPENRTYRYDFFYDDCSTRIRDLLEKAVGEKFIYPPEAVRRKVTFRDKIGEYQRYYPWLDIGIDLLVGTPAEKKTTSRDRMFLPLDLQAGLSEVVINRNGRMVPLLQNPVRELEYSTPQPHKPFVTSPAFIFTFILIGVILFTALNKDKKSSRILDIVLFSLLSLLSLLLVFFNFFSDHLQTKWNLNMLWLSPFIIICLASVIFRKGWILWFRLVFFLSAVSFILILFLPDAFNNAFIPLVILLMLRSSVRADFSWNPLSQQDSF